MTVHFLPSEVLVNTHTHTAYGSNIAVRWDNSIPFDIRDYCTQTSEAGFISNPFYNILHEWSCHDGKTDINPYANIKTYYVYDLVSRFVNLEEMISVLERGSDVYVAQKNISPSMFEMTFIVLEDAKKFDDFYHQRQQLLIHIDKDQRDEIREWFEENNCPDDQFNITEHYILCLNDELRVLAKIKFGKIHKVV